MKKKLSCLLIALAMLAGMSSCVNNSEGIEIDENTKYNMTLTLWLPTSEDTTEAAITQVENAINKITKANYKTAIDICAVADDEYDEAIRERVLEVEEAAKRTAAEEAERKKAEKKAKKKGETLPTESTEVSTEAEIVTNEDGEEEEIYPAASSDQLDIFCIRGYDEFAFYAENGYLNPIDEHIDASSKLLKSYVYPTFLEWGKIPGDTSTYAVPNSHVIGEYTYLLINKEQCDKLYYDPSELATLADCQQFIEDVGATSDITPLLSETWATGMNFWNGAGDTDQFSVLASIVSDEDSPTSRRAMGNVFSLKQFNNNIIMMKELKEKGYIAADPSKVTEFGVGVIKCDGSEIAKYEDDYYINVIARPRAVTEDIYQSMFGVSMYTLDVNRSMEILTLINTDPTVRTILQYGVEGKHWQYNTELTEDGEQTIKIISDDYKMNLVDTGNVFVTYPGENIPMSYWETGKQQNIDSIISPYLGFTNYVTEENQEKIEALDKLSADILKRIEAMTAEEFAANADALKDEIADSVVYADASAGDDVTTITGLYTTFFENVFQGESVM